ncbi:MAG: uroporphyrinogen decarboxylase family protein [Deltaproteobacteria bacterium]|nr:uroporphyrinogen decarboxylase family protein [Deltaproteobacteria bacterium]MBW1816621.1 uroporphyrinogen decarboxylase family protein [Deltaproteobacteria bacterium]MBW2285679.1 uroporphyrinogen decarboxylase family protein [Deltaproteobacteria bacterium]
MNTLTGKKRVSAAFKKTFTDQEIELDRVPAYPIMGQFSAQLIGASIREFLLDTNTFVKAQAAAYERYKPDILLMQRDLLAEMEALGNKLKFPEDSLCISETLALKDKGKLSSLQVPDPTKDARMPEYLESIIEARKIMPEAAVSPIIPGPWTIGIGLRDASELIRDAMKDPDYVHELMAFTTQVAIASGEALVAIKAGPNYSEAPASCSLISPKMYREFVFPYHKQMVDHFNEKKVGIGLHVCGYADPILEDMVNTGVTNISVDAPTDLTKAVEAARGKAVLIGNVNTNLFFSGTREEMADAIKNCLAVAPRDSGYVLASGCEVPGVAPPEKVDWFMELVNELGR